MLVDVRNLGVCFGASIALEDVNIAVPEGSLVGILGANGAGKSTLMGAIAGIVRPSSGAVFFDGDRIDGLRPSQISRRGIRLIPEGRGILPALSVEENLKLFVRGSSLGYVHERFPVLAERSAQPAGTLSGGEQQMLALARALDDDVRVLLVDEPSLGLAPRLVRMVEDTIRHLHVERDVTVVWVEQYASRVLALVDLVYILGRGRVVWRGEPSELRASPVLVKSYLGGSAVDG